MVNEEEKNISPVEINLSPSRVGTYQQCARKYYYNYIQHLPTKDWPHFDLGHLVHGALEFFHEEFRKDGSDVNLRRLMKNSFKAQRDKMEKEKVLSDETLLEARDLLSDYLNSIENKGIGSTIISLEKKFRIPLNDNVYVNGILDRLDVDNDGTYHIKDYKTNKNKKYMKPFQLCVYGIYMLNKYPDIDHFRASYIMMRFGGKYISYDFNRSDVQKCKIDLIQYADRIAEEKKWTPKQSKLCDWCDFKSTCFSTW